MLLAALLAVPAGSTGGGAGTYRNPVLFADYSDPDAIRVGRDYYLVASSFQAVPGLPVLHSRDLVHWSLIGHAAPRLPWPEFDRPQHGKGLWAPSLRHHAGLFWIYVGDPDRGIFLTRARDPRGPWEPLRLVRPARGWIDPCPFWDDDGSAWLVHAFAKSRAGFNGVLSVNRMSADGLRLLDEGTTVFDGGQKHPTIEGPKLYKRNGWYYVFAPAGGVKTGWQTVLRSRSVLGPYEDRIVMDQGTTSVNGPHQGAWVDTPGGASWFLHFQDRGAYGRIVHLQPMAWRPDGWPVIGDDRDGDGKGEPVSEWARPLPDAGQDLSSQAGDEFDGRRLGLQWQWQANPRPEWHSLSARRGALRLQAPPAEGPNLWTVPNLLLQKVPGPSFRATACMEPRGLKAGERAGLVVMGLDYAALVVERGGDGVLRVRRVTCTDADKGGAETAEEERPAPAGPLYLRVTVEPEALCRFSFSRDGVAFESMGAAFAARPGLWVGAKVGLFAAGPAAAGARGYAEFEWFRVE